MPFKRKRWSPSVVRAMSLLSIASLTLVVSGCNEATFRTRCPPLKQYSKEFQAKAATELQRAGPATNQLVSDYGQHRDACRALEKK